MEEIKIYSEPLSKEEHLEHSKDIHAMPVRYHLTDVLKRIQRGRPAESQELIQEVLTKLEENPELGVPFT